MEQARKAGARWCQACPRTAWGGYAHCFQDPDGHLWEIAWNPNIIPESKLSIGSEEYAADGRDQPANSGRAAEACWLSIAQPRSLVTTPPRAEKPPVYPSAAVRLDMARHDDRPRVAGKRLADIARLGGISQAGSDFAIGEGLSRLDGARHLVHRAIPGAGVRKSTTTADRSIR